MKSFKKGKTELGSCFCFYRNCEKLIPINNFEFLFFAKLFQPNVFI